MKSLLIKLMTFAGFLLMPAILSGQLYEIKPAQHIFGQRDVTVTVGNLLYNQLTDPSFEQAIASQEFPDFPTFSCEASDDFIVPDGETWTIDEIHVWGGYSPGGGPVQIAHLRIYENDPTLNRPGVLLFEFPANPVVEDNGMLIFMFTSPLADVGLTLDGGHYWISAQPIMDATTYGQWYWRKKKLPTLFNQFHWRNPGGGFGIPGAENWTPSSALNPDDLDHNLMFGIYGTISSGQEQTLYSVNDVYTNPDIQEGDIIIVGGYYTNPDEKLLLQHYSDWERDQVFPPQSYLVIEGAQPPANAENGGYVIIQGVISFIDNLEPVHPEDAQTAYLNTISIVVIIDGLPPDGSNDKIKHDENWNLIPDNLRDCDSCKFAILISGGGNARNNHSKYWENLVALYNFKVNHQNYCPDNIIVHYYQGTRRDNRIPQANVKTANKEGISDSFDEISRRIARCNEQNKPATFQKMVTNHGASNGDINLLGDNRLTPTELKDMEQKIIDSCCRTMYDEFLQCYGGHSVDAMRSLDNKNKTTIYANSNADQSYGYSPHGQVHRYLAAKLASLTANNSYPEAVVSAKLAYDNYLQGLANNAHNGAMGWRNTAPGWYVVEGSLVFISQAYINNQINLWVADSTEIASNICKSRNVTIVPMKEYCEWKEFVVPPGGQLVLDFKGNPSNCGNVSVYKGSKNNKVGVWNWNLPGSWGFNGGNNQRVINGDEDQPTTFWIHNDNGEFTLTASSNGNQNLDESLFNVTEYPGFSFGGNDNSSDEFGEIVSPFQFYENIDQIPMSTLNLPRWLGSDFVQEFGFTFTINPDDPYWSEMELYLNINEVLAPGTLEIMAENSSIGFAQLNINAPGVYTIPLGAMGEFGAFGFMMMNVPFTSDLTFSFDSWGLRTQHQEILPPEPFEGFLVIGDYVNPEPWNNWVGGGDGVTKVTLMPRAAALTPQANISQVTFSYSTDDLIYFDFYTDVDGSFLVLNSVGPSDEPGDGWSGYLPHEMLPQIDFELFIQATVTLFDGSVHIVKKSAMFDPTPPSAALINITDWMMVEEENLLINIDPALAADLLEVQIKVEDKPEEFFKGIPVFDQWDEDGCASASAAACLKWFADTLADNQIMGGLTLFQLYLKLYEYFNTSQHVNEDGTITFGARYEDVISGLEKWISENGDGYRVTLQNPFDWNEMRNELEKKQDVLTTFYYNTPDGVAGHQVTFNSIKNRPEENGTIRVDFMDPWGDGDIKYGYLNPETGQISGYTGELFNNGIIPGNIIICPNETTINLPDHDYVVSGPDFEPLLINLGEPGLKWIRLRFIDASGHAWQEDLVLERLHVDPPMEFAMRIGDYLLAEPWHDWIGGEDGISRVQLFADDPDNTIQQVNFYWSIEGELWNQFYTDTDGAIANENSTEMPDEDGDGWSGYFPHEMIPQEEMDLLFKAEVITLEGDVFEHVKTKRYDPTPPSGVEILGVEDFMMIENNLIELTVLPGTCLDFTGIQYTLSKRPTYYDKGIPHVGQKDGDHPNEGKAYCAPTAAAACFKYFADSLPDPFIMGGIEDIHDLIDSLAVRCRTNPMRGTLPDDLADGMMHWILENGWHYSLRGPDEFDWKTMRSELLRSQNVLAGFYWPEGGHRMTMNSVKFRPEIDGKVKVDFMDPWTGNEAWGYLDPETGELTGFTGIEPSGSLGNIIIVCPNDPAAIRPGDPVYPGSPDVYVSIEVPEPGYYTLEVRAIDASEHVHTHYFMLENPLIQEMPIAEGWSGISSWVEPANSDLNSLMQPVLDDLVVLYNLEGAFWPAQNLTTISDWDAYSGYIAKTTGDVVLPFSGQEVEDKSLLLNPGWNLMPVLSSEPFSIETLFVEADGFVLAKDVAGFGVYWPQYGINTIGNVMPGKAYWVLVLSQTTVDFNVIGIFKSSSDFVIPEINSPWDKVSRTPSSHLVVFSPDNNPFIPGDVIGGFTADGTLAGVWSIFDAAAANAVTLFGNDPTGVEQSGFATGEQLSFKVYRSATKEIFDLEVSYNPQMNTGNFETNGLSEVRAVKLAPTGLQANQAARLNIFPNPTEGVFTISGLEGEVRLSVINAFGAGVLVDFSNMPAQIDLSGQSKGVYFIKVETSEGTYFEKIVLN